MDSDFIKSVMRKMHQLNLPVLQKIFKRTLSTIVIWRISFYYS